MTTLYWVAGLIVLVVLIRDAIFRVLVIHPRTDASGRYAAYVEADDVYRWLAPVLAGEHGDYEVYFAGNSHVLDGIDCRIVGEKTGLRCYNLGLYSLPTQNALDLLFEFDRFPKLLFVDFASRYGTYIRSENVIERARQAVGRGRLRRLMDDLGDRFQWLMPSLFVPRQFSPVLFRSIGKIREYRSTGRMGLGRYTPFRPFVSYDWWLDTTTNHRFALRRRERTKWEREREEYLLEKCLQENDELCQAGSEAYLNGMRETERMMRDMLARGVRIVFMRMPMDRRVIEREDADFAFFFDDVRSMAERLEIPWVDLTTDPHRQQLEGLEYYSDGQHVAHPTDIILSRYLATLIQTGFEQPHAEGAA